MKTRLGVVLCCGALLSACGADKMSGTDNGNPSGETTSDAAKVPEFGTAAERQFTLVASAAHGLNIPRDLEFHPDRPNELWIVNRAYDGTVTLFDPGTPAQRADKRIDSYGNHFMEEVSSVAFGASNTFATCQESRNTYNNAAAPNDFMGPALWPADMSVYAKVNQHNTLLGSHLDMLHESPYCMGIAHDKDNGYWAFDGLNGHIVFYDFKRDHGPGHDDHSDGVVHRYPDVKVTRVPDVASHMELDPATGWLYIADTGAHRIIRMNTTTGTKAGNLNLVSEPLAEYARYTGATVEVFVSQGLDKPSGLALHDGRLFVSDYGTGHIAAYDLTTGAELDRVLTTGQGIMGLTVGPEGKLWYADAKAHTVMRLDP